MEREAVALGEAEPIDGRSEDSVVSIVCARSLFLAVGVRSCGVKVRLKGVRAVSYTHLTLPTKRIV